MKELERFAQIVLARRTELGLTQAEVEENGGPSIDLGKQPTVEDTEKIAALFTKLDRRDLR